MKSRLVTASTLAASWLCGFALGQDAPPIAGRVVDAERGTPISDADVFGPGGLTKSDASGRFELPRKPDSEDQMILARAAGRALQFLPLADVAADDDVVIWLAPERIVTVRVVGEDGRPVRGARVRGRLPFAPAYSTLERLDFAGVTDQDGVAILKGMPADAPIVAEVAASRMIPAQSLTIFPAAPKPEGQPPVVMETITVTPGRALTIAVEDGARKPLAGAEVRLLPLIEPRLDFGGHATRDTTKGPIRTGVTDARGTASFSMLPAEPITCEVRAPGMLTRLVVVDATAGAAKPTRVRLDPDPDPPGRDIPWRTTTASAADESRRTGRPVFLVMTMDGEKANDWMSGHHYHDPEIVRVARRVVPLLSSAFGEGGVGADPDHKETDGVCTRYGSISCRAHQEVERAAREALMNEREAFEVPRHIATAPDGRRLLHRVFYLSERDLSRLMVHALRVTAPGEALTLARERLAGILEDLASADGAARARGVRALLLLVNSGDEHAAAIVQGLESLGLPPGTRAAIAGGLRASAISAPEVTLRGLFRDSDREVRRAAFASMSELAANEAMLAELAPELGTKDGQLRETLFAALGIERKADEVRVHAPGVANRWMLIEQLVGTPEAGRVQDIEPALEIVSAEGRNRIIRALGRRAAPDEWARKPLLRTLSGPGRVAALRALAPAAAAAKPPSPLVAAFTEGIRSGDPLVREEALRAVGTHEIPVDAEALAESLAHPWPAVRIQAGLALWRLGDRRGQTILFAAMHDLELGARVRATLGPR